MVSIIVPVYKSEETLTRCVESLLAQTYEDIEILLVVEAPPDGSGILAEELAKRDGRIRILNQKNEGVSNARNFGLKNAKGEYIRFVDSDDYVLPNSVEILVEVMQKTEADLVIAGFHHLYFGRRILKNPELKASSMLCEVTGETVQVFSGSKAAEEAYMYELYQAGFLNMPWNKLFKKSMIQEHFRRELNLGEDLLFNLAYMEQVEKFAVAEASVCEYIQDDRGTTLSTKRRENKLKLTLEFYEEVKKAFAKLYTSQMGSKILRDKLVSEFLDDVEGLAFEKSMSKNEKKQLIGKYQDALQTIVKEAGKDGISLQLLDYKIIYYFMKRKQTGMTYLMVCLRGLVVKLLGKRG